MHWVAFSTTTPAILLCKATMRFITRASPCSAHSRTYCNNCHQRLLMILTIALPSVLQNATDCAIAGRKTRRHDMFRPYRGQIAQRRHNNGAVVRALPSLSSLLLPLSLDDNTTRHLSCHPPCDPPPPPRRRPRIATAPRPPPTTPARGGRQRHTTLQLPQGQARPPPPTSLSLNDNLPPP